MNILSVFIRINEDIVFPLCFFQNICKYYFKVILKTYLNTVFNLEGLFCLCFLRFGVEFSVNIGYQISRLRLSKH